MRIGDEVYIHGYIDEIRKNTVIIQNEGGYFGTVPSEIKLIEPKPKVGHWIDEPNCYFRCSECGKHYPHTSIYGAKGYNYCPHCGAKMESEVSK